MDSQYATYPSIFVSRGINARPVDDRLPDGAYMNLQNVEEVQENALCSRLGSVIVNATGATVNALPAAVHSLGRLNDSITSTAYRYAGAGSVLYRRTGNMFGPYTSIATGLSGQPWSSISYRPFLSSFPYQFFADAAKMLKDNGATTQQMGIFAPTSPVGGVPISNAAPAILPPLTLTVDSMENPTASYTASGFSGSLSLVLRVNTTLTSAVVFVTANPTFVTVASMTNIDQFAWVDINSGGGTAETVQVLTTTATGFTAVFTHLHSTSETVNKQSLSGTVPTNSTATITKTGTYNLGTFPGGVATEGADYIGFAVNVDNPTNLNEIRLQFDVSDDTFTASYYFKALIPNINQQTVSNLNNQTLYVSQVIYQEAIGVFSAGAISGYQLTTGENQWTQILIPMSSFQNIGQASLTSNNYTMADITSFQVQITTNSNGPVTVSCDTIFAMGGYGLDSFAGVAYDWLYTYYNANTGVESNPCMFMANVDPPTNTKQVIPRRQAVKLNLLGAGDPQVTHIRIYRRGGTLASNFYRVDQITNPGSGGFTYTDSISDAQIEAADTISFTNDVPVTSTLPVPVNTTLSIALTPVSVGIITTITPVSMANISVNQQVTIGKDTDPNQEIVIVIQVTSSTTFAAYIQNPHSVGDPVTAQAAYGQPMNLMALAYGRAWFAGDTNNPHFLYYSNATSVEQVSSANSIEVGTPTDPITAIVPFQGSLYVATLTRWYGISPITQIGGTPTVYPTTAVHGVVAPFGWITTESEIWHQAIDGIRSFAGGNSVYRTQDIEFLFQNNGTTPIVIANPAQLNQTRMTYWNNIVFLSYIGMNGNIYRLCYHTQYKRWRNDDTRATSMFTEPDTNALLYGDANGLIHQDRVGFVRQTNNAGTIANTPLAINLQTAYLDQGSPKNQKNYNELTIDCNTGGNTLTAELLFDDGEETVTVGTFSTTQRSKVNLNINSGLGQQAYRVSLQVTGNCASETILYQADIRGVLLAETRQSLDSYWLAFGTDESKLAKQLYLEYESTQALAASVYYDQFTVPLFTFTLAPSARVATRIRFPAVKFRLLRMVITSTADFQIWQSSHFEIKPVCSTKGYQHMTLVA